MADQHTSDSQEAARELFALIFSKVVTQCLGVVAELGIADLLKDGECSTADLARESGAHEPSLYRVLRMLTGHGIFEESSPGVFRLTSHGEPLRADSPNTLRDFAIFAAHPVHNAAYSALGHTVRTGENAFKHAHGSEVFEYFRRDPEFFSVLNAAMVANSHREAPAIGAAYDFSGLRTVADVGGGLGFLLSEVLRRNPSQRGVLFDLPEVVAGARATFEAADQLDRVTLQGGSFLESVPLEADAYMMKYVIHDWDDARAATILRNCRRSMMPDGKILVIETVVPENDDWHIAKLLDIEMLAVPGGQERTRTQFEELFSKAELRLTRVVPTAAGVCILECVRA